MAVLGCRTPPPRLELVQRSQPLLGTFVTITAYGPDRQALQSAVSKAFDEFRNVDALLSIHRADSELARLNASAGRGPVELSPELARLLRQALEISHQTDGAFDVTIGPVAQLWGFIWKEHRLPSPEELARVLPLVGHTNVFFRADGRVELRKAGMMLDFGGIGKGMAVDRAIESLERAGVARAMVKAGGDLRVIGLPPGEQGWEVQIEDPAKQGQRTAVRLRSGALSTSGSYENYFEVEGRRYSHILDPRTGLPVQGLASCTVLAPACAESDALATAFFVMGPEGALARFGKRMPIRFATIHKQAIESEAFAETWKEIR